MQLYTHRCNIPINKRNEHMQVSEGEYVEYQTIVGDFIADNIDTATLLGC